MKVNVIKAKDKYAQSWGSLDWYDHISGMSVSDVELEMEYVCEQVTAEILKELINEVEILKAMGLGDTERCKRKERLIKEATEL